MAKLRDRVKAFRRVSAKELLRNPKNYRTHPQGQQDALRGILAEVGIAGALVAYETPEGLQLIDGHLRADTEPDTKWPVIVLDVTEAEAAKLLATLDPLAAMAEIDAAKLEALLGNVETENDGLAKLLADLEAQAIGPAPEVSEDTIPEPPKVPTTKPGDLWLLGEHRLLCGDSTKAEDVARLMDGQKAILMSTDPPYGVDFAGAKYNPRAKQWDGIANDKLTGADLKEFLASVLAVWLPLMDTQSAFYFWTAAMQEGAAAAAAIRESGLHIQSQIIWNKNCLVLGQADYHWKHENCWYAFWKGKKHRWFGERTQTTVWDVSKVANAAYEHPMQKPVELYAIAMRHHTREGEIVAEPFSGSGSQFIAAEQLNRRCYGMELEPAYCDVIVARWEALTGKKATREKAKKRRPATV